MNTRSDEARKLTKRRKKMLDYRRTAAFVGALFLFSNVTFLLGAVLFIEPTINAPDYLRPAANIN